MVEEKNFLYKGRVTFFPRSSIGTLCFLPRLFAIVGLVGFTTVYLKMSTSGLVSPLLLLFYYFP